MGNHLLFECLHFPLESSYPSVPVPAVPIPILACLSRLVASCVAVAECLEVVLYLHVDALTFSYTYRYKFFFMYMSYPRESRKCLLRSRYLLLYHASTRTRPRSGVTLLESNRAAMATPKWAQPPGQDYQCHISSKG